MPQPNFVFEIQEIVRRAKEKLDRETSVRQRFFDQALSILQNIIRPNIQVMILQARPLGTVKIQSRDNERERHAVNQLFIQAQINYLQDQRTLSFIFDAKTEQCILQEISHDLVVGEDQMELASLSETLVQDKLQSFLATSLLVARVPTAQDPHDD
jgi:hypothetical protein